jgi:hypothetical protein
MRKNVVAIDNVLQEIYSAFTNKIKIKNYLEKYCSNPQCFVRKTKTLSSYDLSLL